MKTSIVLGTLFGDEGKGFMTSCLASEGDLVVRFNGGHQAGHTVEQDGYRHIFSTFGSGTMNKADTYISEYCTVYPPALVSEQKMLREKGYYTKIFLHPLTMITTPFDVAYNKETESKNRHGSVGVGFGATVARNTETPYKLFAIDLLNEHVTVQKLLQIAKYYQIPFPEQYIEPYFHMLQKADFYISQLHDIKSKYNNIVFEGAQGIMLDMDFGFFPNVTRSNTTSKNALQIIKDNRLPPVSEVYYCLRSYLTRHGNGFMPNEDENLQFEDKTNVKGDWQGNFRQGWHSIELIRQAYDVDNIYSGFDVSKNLVISHLDQTENMIYAGKGKCKLSVEEFVTLISRRFKRVFVKNYFGKPIEEYVSENYLK